MKLKFDRSQRRIAFALIFSLMLHSWVLWGPSIQLPQFNSSLPPLTAKLEALPAETAKPSPRHPKAKSTPPAPAPKEAAPATSPSADEKLAESAPVAASSVAAASEVTAASEVAAASAPAAPPPSPPKAPPAAARPALPREAQLTFSIYKGSGSFRVGETVHRLQIHEGHYELLSTTRTVGVVSLLTSFEFKQSSTGKYTQSGLEPEEYVEERKERSGTESIAAHFNQTSHRVSFTDGSDRTFPDDTQDVLSVMYQFPPLAHTETTSLSVCNGRKVERYDFEILPNEEIDTPIGKLTTVHLRKLRKKREEGFDIWLAREYRLFPVKIRYFDSDGEVAAEARITDIRVSPEEGERSNVDH